MAYVNFAQPASYDGNTVPNPLVVPKKNDIKDPKYTPKEYAYQSYLCQRLTRAKENRDTPLAEFNKKTYKRYYEENEKIANTYVEPVADKNEEPLSTGTIEGKLNTLLAHVNNLNITPIVNAFDRNNQTLRELGQSFTDIMAVLAEHDGGDDGGDKEKRMARQRELLKQGTVFVQENWVTRYEIKKRLKSAYKGKFKDFDGYDERLEKVFEGCARDVLYGPNVYLGDITAFSMNDQPYVFTVEHIDYSVAKTIYGTFENFQYVTPGVPDKTTADSTGSVSGDTVYDAKFRLTKVRDSQVEVIKYQDPSQDEFMIMINGIMILPPGFPLSAVTPGGRFNIAKQTLYIINSQFAYGKSFVSSGAVYELSKALDRLIRLFELKTRKSINPPYVNTTSRVIPARVLNPGNITMGIPANALQPIGSEGQGVTSNEFQIFKELQDEIEKSTISNIFQGQQAKSGATATEIIEVQRQAKLTLGLIVAAVTLLEIKVGYLRLYNIIANWLKPVDVFPDGTSRYRSVSRDVMIEGAGRGQRLIIPIDGELPPPDVIRILSLEDEQNYGYPVRRYYMNPKLVQESNIRWFITAEPREEETSSYHKIMFREMLGDAVSLVQLGASVNIEGLTDEYGKVYNVDKAKIFSGNAQQPPIDAATIVGDRASGNNVAGVAKQPQPKPQVSK